MNSFSLTGECAVVTGGTAGIGHALALGFARAGANVIAASRSEEATARVAQEITALGTKSLRVSADVTDRTSVEHLHQCVIEQFGAADILVNCAGATRRIPTLDYSEALWKSIFDINLTGTLRACQISAAA